MSPPIYNGIPPPTPTPIFETTPTPILIVNLPPSSLDIVTDAPLTMQVNQSYVIEVSLVPKGQSIVSSGQSV